MKKTLKEFLEKNNACKGGYLFAKDLTLEEFLATCPRGDWILWLFVKSNPDSLKELTLAKGHCANTVRHLMEDKKSIKAVDVAIAFGEGKATKKELNSASAAAYAAYAAYATYAAYDADAASNAAYAAYAAYATYATYAASAASGAAYDASNAAYAAYAASDASAAYAAAATYAASAAFAASAASGDSTSPTYKQNQMETADICRRYLPLQIWNIK
jgi:hypothetical protein